MNILVTRPEPGASATAALLTALGHTPVRAPCLAITRRAASWPKAPGALVVTSGQAVPALPTRYRHLPVFCVGDATAEKLREAGFGAVASAGGNAEDLFRLIVGRPAARTYLLAVGAGHGLALAAQLRAAGRRVTRRCAYAATPVQNLPAAAAAALARGEIAAALFYSAESAAAFTRLRPPGTAGVMALALSPAVAQGLGGLPWRAIRVALAPTEAELLALLA